MASTLVADGLDARQSVERFSTHELGPTLERFQASGMLEEGRINLIGLDAIAERLGHQCLRAGFYTMRQRVVRPYHRVV